MPEAANREKILYIITKSLWGGAQRYVYDLAANLPPGAFDIAVACGEGGPLTAKLALAGVRTIVIPSLRRDISAPQELRSLVSLVRTLRRERPDIVHLNSSKAGGLGAVAAFAYKLLTLNFKRLTVFTVHGWPFREPRPMWQRFGIFAASWLSTLLADRVILLSRSDYAAASRFIRRGKLRLIRHGLAPIAFRPRAESRRFFSQAIGRPILATEILIGATAELTANKGLTYLIDAINQVKSQIPNSKFQTVIIGEGELRGELERQIRSKGLGGRVHLLGFVPDAERYLRGLDLFVLPSLKEGLPYALMEAMAAGLAIAASRVGGIPDLIRDGGEGLLVPPADPSALARAIAALIGDQDRAGATGARARERLQDECRMETMLRRTIAAYR